ncbi:MAG: hypothetical protein OXU20_31590 [Myxococcales bacterium]|nr:hypothetical protein [Myxococcales bacterium]
MRRWNSRFDEGTEGDPMAAMATLVDVMLVFACGLMAALVMGQLKEPQHEGSGEEVQKARVLSQPPRGMGDVGGGFHPVGRVFRDPDSGKLILVESPGGASSDASP